MKKKRILFLQTEVYLSVKYISFFFVQMQIKEEIIVSKEIKK